MRALRAEGHSLRHLLECSGLRRSTYYYALAHPRRPTRPELRDAAAEIFSRTANGCGHRQIAMCLRAELGAVVADKTVLKMMREMGIRCGIRRRGSRRRYSSYRGPVGSRGLKDREFSFELVKVKADGSDGKVVATAKNGADGKVSFPEVKLDAAGTYGYRIREARGDEPGVSYDGNEYGLTVRATDNGDGTLKCEVAYEGSAMPEFVNVLRKPGTFVARAHKVLNGRELKAGEFGFELIGLNDDGTEGDVVATAENDAAGNVVFPAVEVASVGTYRYRVREKAGSESGITYDIATYDLTVTAVDNGDDALTCSIAYANESEPQFVNTYTPPTVPPSNPPANPPSTTTTTQTTTTHKRKRGTMPSTGDDTWALACGMALAGSVTCALGIASRRRKRQ